MKKSMPALAAVFSLILTLPLAAANSPDFGSIDRARAAQAPEAGAPEADLSSLQADYQEIYSALAAYSEIAFNATQDSGEFLEASAAGQYLRGRLQETGALISRLSGSDYNPGFSRGRAYISQRMIMELNEVFGFYTPSGRGGKQGETFDIMPGYCKVRYVKDGVPFLVQSDSFLKKGEVILTFDDGPGVFTEEVSAAMKEAGAPSVFFVLGSKLGEAGRQRAARASADGHELAVHGYWHATENGKPFTGYSTGKILEQLGGVKDTIQGISGRKPAFFRPPYGIMTPDALKALDSKLGLVPVGWTVDTLDWSTKDPEELFQKSVSLVQKRGKGIILMHDIHDQSRQAVRKLVKWLGDNGYKVVSPDRMTRAYRSN